MAKVNQDIFQKFQKASLVHKRQDGDGHEIQVEVREDEEQSVKLQEIIDTLVAAGYYRARIKGLSPFDKVVGGMTWCIESLDVDVDVDLLFQENSTIGQKIALTEKIVAVLPKIKCPHVIEPHQIQGLDFIHIYPVIQWLVKVSLEARQEKSTFVRSYALNQYEKQFPSKSKGADVQKDICENLKVVEDVYRPRRYYKRKNAPPPDILSRVQITLLEYGILGGVKWKQQTVGDKDSSQNVDDNSISTQHEEQQNLEQLLANLTVTKEEIVNDSDLSEEDKQTLIKHYEALSKELKDGHLLSKENQEVAVLEEQNKLLDESIAKLAEKKYVLKEQIDSESNLLAEIRLKQNEAEKTLAEFSEEERKNSSAVKEIEELVILNDTLKSQEASFKESCKKEMARLQKEIGELKQMKSPVELTPEQQKQIDEFTEKLKLVRLQLAKKNQIVAKLQRQLDDVPNRAELAQYQRRFLELYNQVASKYKETKQYYSLYNTLEDKRRYMQKELSLLNSVAENYPQAKESSAGKEEFLKQLQNIVEGLKQNRTKIERQVLDEKKKRDQMADSLQNMLELQRAYASAVRQLSLECKKYEALLATKKNDG